MQPLLLPAQIGQLQDILKPGTSIVITTHKNPDGDAMGSSLALANYLNKIGMEAQVVIPNDSPAFLKWMAGFSDCIDFSLHPDKAKAAFEKAKVLFCLDFNAPKRVEQMEPLISGFKGFKVLIDHHPEPENFAEVMISRPDYGSTCELIYKFITELWQTETGQAIAECLYTGIMTDSGSFRFPSTTAETHRIVAALMDQGARHAKIHRSVYDDFTEKRLKLLGHCLTNRLTVIPGYATAFIYLTKEDLAHFEYKKGDTEGIVNYPLAIGSVVFSAIFIEMDEQVKISFRSKGTFSVNQFSRENFGGGGHTNAAGGVSYEPLLKTLEKFKSLVPKYNPQLSE